VKNFFPWYLEPDERGKEAFWDECTVTMDANVLLDMYRYQASTRDQFFDVLRFFSSRLWLTPQVAEEFFRNRKNVIRAKNSSYGDAIKELNKISSSLDEPIGRIKKTRVLDDEVFSELHATIKDSFSKAVRSIEAARVELPVSTESDLILDQILNFFDGKISEKFPSNEIEVETKEAARRSAKKIPPGYMDEKEKDDDKKYGDYFFWRQVLINCKKKNVDAVLITSESKEDWMDSDSGGLIGPRFELMKEAFEYSGRRVVILSPDQFLGIASKHVSKKKNDSQVDWDRYIKLAIEEVKKVVAERNRRPRGTVHQLYHEIKNVVESGIYGEVTIDVDRTISVITTQVKFPASLHIADGPVDAFVSSAPSDFPDCKVTVGEIGHNGFNLHVSPNQFGAQMPPGRYVVCYRADVADKP
jgi:hypothetical protein